MTHQSFVTYDEIITQTKAWMEAVRVVSGDADKIKELDLNSYRQAIFIGCGSTYYLSLSAASIFQSMTGVPARALPSSEILFFPESVYPEGKILLVAISRSGKTSETLRAVKDFKANHHGDVIVITNYSDSLLFALGDIRISINAGQEVSVAQTRSFASMLVAATTLSSILGHQKRFDQYTDVLKKAGNKLIDNHRDLAEKHGMDHNINQVFFLGSGFRYGLASEASLKLKEMSQTVTEAFHFFEFRHGPISMVDSNTLVIGLMSNNAFDHEMGVIKDVLELGAHSITIGEERADIKFNSGLPESAQAVLYLPFLQLLAYYRAVGFDKNPDKPRNLTAVVELDIEK